MVFLSKCLTLGFAGSVCALALAVVSEPSAAQSRFNGQNDVPGAVVVDPDQQKINPDTIPDFPSTGDTSVRPRFYMSPGSRCTELEDPLPGGCEANTLQRDGFARELIEGEISPFPLVLPPLPPVALVPPPNLRINLHLPRFVLHPALPPALALPLVVRPVPSLPAIHVVFPPRQMPVSPIPVVTLPFHNRQGGGVHKTVFLNKLVFTSRTKAQSAVTGLDAVLTALHSGHGGVSVVRIVQAQLPSLAFLRALRAPLNTSLSEPGPNRQTSFYSEDISKYGIAHPLRSPSPRTLVRPPIIGFALPTYARLGKTHSQLPRQNYANAYASGSIRSPALSSAVVPETVVKSLVRKSTIAIGSPPNAHGATLAHPTAFVLR